ncbi:ABC transporter permease [Christensenellaceae bacterium OttesenSCG-928-K19]|nr:ABC transporter permease [Christensenellaceae bacterium OttesenSCG-928-K19]
MKTLYKYRLKCILGDRANMFWTLVFPILLGTLFYVSFGQLLTNIEQLEPIPVAIVEQQQNESFSETLESLASGEDAFITPQHTNKAQALSMLESEEVDGIYVIDESPSLTVKTDGLNQSMLKSVLDSYLQVTATVTTVAHKDPALIADTVRELTNPPQAVEQISLSSGSLDFMRENFYALIAMTCLYGSFFGLSGAVSAQPNLSALGARRSIAPTPKLTGVWSDILAAVTVMFGIVLVLIAYLSALPNIDFGGNIPAILLTSLCGVFVGVMLGMLIGVAVRGSRGTKDGFLISISLLLCFFSGLMYSNMRFIVEKNAPIFNRINPASLIVDSFYTLDAYGAGERFWTNIVLLAAIGGILCAASVAILRRKQYASI